MASCIKTFFLLIFLSASSWIFSDNIKIKQDLTLRVSAGQDSKNRYIARPVGILPAGSIVDIPNEYIIKDNSGQVNIDFTLQNWFKKGSKEFYSSKGDVYLVYTPIKVVHPAMPELNNKQLHAGLYDLRLKDETSTLMEVVSDTNLLSVIKSEEEKNQTEAGSCEGFCVSTEETIDSETQDFIASLRDINENLINQTTRDSSLRKSGVLQRTARRLDSNLERHCGLSSSALCSELSAEIQKNKLPFKPSELMGLMIMESSGVCTAVNNNGSSSDYGLFQINTVNLKKDLKSNKVKKCSNKAIQNLAGQAKQAKSARQFWAKQGPPKCVRNPMYSLKKAIDVLKENMRYLSSGIPGITEPKHRDLFRRLLLSSYNGGAGHVFNALRDLKLFNTDLQKKLSDGGKDITRSNRGIRLIKSEIDFIDGSIFNLTGDISTLTSNIRTNKQLVEKVSKEVRDLREQIPDLDQNIVQNTQSLSEIKRSADKEVEKVKTTADSALSVVQRAVDSKVERVKKTAVSEAERVKKTADSKIEEIKKSANEEVKKLKQTIKAEIQQEIRGNISKTKSLVDKWNTLNKEELSLLKEQRGMLDYLNSRSANLRKQRQRYDSGSPEDRRLAFQEKSLERLIEEIGETKWPYLMGPLLTSTHQHKSEQVDRENSPGFYAVRDGLKRFGGFMTDLYSHFKASDKDWDFYEIQKLEKQLKKKQKEFSTTAGQNFSRLNKEIENLRTQITAAKNQRTQDIENIMNVHYRKSMTQNEQARALKILTAEIDRITAQQAEESSFLDSLKGFFSTNPEIEKLESMKQAVETDIQENLSFLSSVLSRPDGSGRRKNYLFSLDHWERERGRIDAERKGVNENQFFKIISPYLNSKNGSEGTRILDLSNSARRFVSQYAEAKRVQARISGVQAVRSEEQSRLQNVKASAQSQRENIRSEEQSRLQRIRSTEHKKIQSIKSDAQRRRESIRSEEQSRRQSISAEIASLHAKLKQAQMDLSSAQSIRRDKEGQLKQLIRNKVEKLDQKSVFENRMEKARADLAVSRKDPYSWEDLKGFYFAAELKSSFSDAGFRSRRRSRLSILNISYVDSLLGTNNHEGFVDTEEGKSLCR